MRGLLALALASVAAPASPPDAVRYSGVYDPTAPDGLQRILPPSRFQADVAVVTVFSADAVARYCGPALACVIIMKDGSKAVLMPNPCLVGTDDAFAGILCHEIGHVNGWPPTHGK